MEAVFVSLAFLTAGEEKKTWQTGLCRMQVVIESMDNASISVLVYPTWSNPPLLIGDYGSLDGELHSRRHLSP